MNSINKIEQIITDMENYLANCKNRAFSSTDVIVNRDDMEEMLEELRRKTPEEIKQYQKIIAQKEAILADAAERADAMRASAEQQAKALLEQAAAEHNQMISEHEVMLRAQARADEFVNMAMNKAQGIVDNATMEANALKDAANHYMEDVLEHLEKIISSASQAAVSNFNRTMQYTQDNYQKTIGSLNEYQEIIRDNIRQLHPEEEAAAVPEEKEESVSSEK
ncbi:MAG: vacuolar family H+-ATPase subunit H [Lachnospiraceae bacterium]|nr:vacuolar family H+-ATPase subunit H [Lachnospiraceae bacterium]MBP5221792.1 vacuolar family H+-ATPase subunit H [Lachnospiraceae bacterium]